MKQMITSLICITLLIQYGSTDSETYRSKRSFKIFDNFGKDKEVKQIHVSPAYPIYKVHKYNGLQLKPISLAELSYKSVHPPTEPPPKSQILPSLEQLKLLLGTTSDAETYDALRELAKTRHGLRMAAGFIKANIENAKALSKSEKKEPHLDYKYSVSAEDTGKPFEDVPAEEIEKPEEPFKQYEVPSKPEKPFEQYGVPSKPEKPFEQYGVPSEPKKPFEEYGVPSEEKEKPFEHYSVPVEHKKSFHKFIVPSSNIKLEEKSKNPIQKGFDYVKSIFSPKEQKKVFIPPSIYELPKVHHQQFINVQPNYGVPEPTKPIHFDSKAEFDSNSESHENRKPLPYYDVPKIKEDSSKQDLNSRFDFSQFEESSSGSSQKIFPVSFANEYGPPPPEYGAPNKHQFSEFSNKFQGGFSKQNEASKSDVKSPETTYGLPSSESHHNFHHHRVNHFDGVSIQSNAYGLPSNNEVKFGSVSKTNFGIDTSSAGKFEKVKKIENTYGLPSSSESHFGSVSNNHFGIDSSHTGKFESIKKVENTYGLPSTSEGNFGSESKNNFGIDFSNAGKFESVKKIENTYGLPSTSEGKFESVSKNNFGIDSSNSGKFENVKKIEHTYGLPSSSESRFGSVSSNNFKIDSSQSGKFESVKKIENTYGLPSKSEEGFGTIVVAENNFGIDSSNSGKSEHFKVPEKTYGTPVFNEATKTTFIANSDSPKFSTVEKIEIVPFPILPHLPSLPEPELLHKHDRKSVFSFSGPATVISDTSFFKPEVVKTVYEQPGFSYTQLSKLPLDEGANLKKTSDRISSYGDEVSPYVFNEDYASAPSEQKTFVVKADIKLGDKKVKHRNIDTVTSAPRKKWVPKSKRKRNN